MSIFQTGLSMSCVLNREISTIKSAYRLSASRRCLSATTVRFPQQCLKIRDGGTLFAFLNLPGNLPAASWMLAMTEISVHSCCLLPFLNRSVYGMAGYVIIGHTRIPRRIHSLQCSLPIAVPVTFVRQYVLKRRNRQHQQSAAYGILRFPVLS